MLSLCFLCYCFFCLFFLFFFFGQVFLLKLPPLGVIHSQRAHLLLDGALNIIFLVLGNLGQNVIYMFAELVRDNTSSFSRHLRVNSVFDNLRLKTNLPNKKPILFPVPLCFPCY